MLRRGGGSSAKVLFNYAKLPIQTTFRWPPASFITEANESLSRGINNEFDA